MQSKGVFISYCKENKECDNCFWANLDSIFPAQSAAANTIASPTETDYHQLAEIVSDINASGEDQGDISSVLICSLIREGTNVVEDTYASDIYLVSLDFHIEMDTVGSRMILVK